MCVCLSMADQERCVDDAALCLAAAPDLFGCALVVGRVLEGRALVPGRARAAPVLRLPVRVVAVFPGGFVMRVVGAGPVLRVEAVVGVRSVLGVALGPVLSAGAVLVQLPVLAVAVVSAQPHTHTHVRYHISMIMMTTQPRPFTDTTKQLEILTNLKILKTHIIAQIKFD